MRIEHRLHDICHVSVDDDGDITLYWDDLFNHSIDGPIADAARAGDPFAAQIQHEVKDGESSTQWAVRVAAELARRSATREAEREQDKRNAAHRDAIVLAILITVIATAVVILIVAGIVRRVRGAS